MIAVRRAAAHAGQEPAVLALRPAAVHASVLIPAFVAGIPTIVRARGGLAIPLVLIPGRVVTIVGVPARTTGEPVVGVGRVGIARAGVGEVAGDRREPGARIVVAPGVARLRVAAGVVPGVGVCLVPVAGVVGVTAEVAAVGVTGIAGVAGPVVAGLMTGLTGVLERLRHLGPVALLQRGQRGQRIRRMLPGHVGRVEPRQRTAGVVPARL